MTETFEDIVCTFCGCLCDDLIIEVSGNKIQSNKNGCPISKEKYVGHEENRILVPDIDGAQVQLAQAIEKKVKSATIPFFPWKFIGFMLKVLPTSLLSKMA